MLKVIIREHPFRHPPYLSYFSLFAIYQMCHPKNLKIPQHPENKNMVRTEIVHTSGTLFEIVRKNAQKYI